MLRVLKTKCLSLIKDQKLYGRQEIEVNFVLLRSINISLLPSQYSDRKWRSNDNITLVKCLIQLHLRLLTLLVELETNSNFKVVIEPILFISEIKLEFLPSTHFLHLALMGHQNDHLYDLVSNLFERS